MASIIPDGIRSNKTNKLAKRAFELSGERSAVLGPRGLIGRASRKSPFHDAAVEGLMTQMYGPDYSIKQLDDFVDKLYKDYETTGKSRAFDTQMGFTKPRERFITREDAFKELKDTRSKTNLFTQGEIHTGDLSTERNIRLSGAERISDSRRGEGTGADLIKKQRGVINKYVHDINLKLKELRKAEKGLPKDSFERERIVARRETLRGRKQTLLSNMPHPGGKDPGRLSVLANKARRMGRLGKKALGPFSWLTEPFGAPLAVGDLLSPDKTRQQAGQEYFLGLTREDTGRTATKREMRDYLKQGDYKNYLGAGGI